MGKGGLARRMRRKSLVRSTDRDVQAMQRDVQLAQAVGALQDVVQQIVAALYESGIKLEKKTETGIVIPGSKL